MEQSNKYFYRQNSYIKIFIIGFLCAFVLFLPFLILDKGFFLYAGDYNSQQIPFYTYMVNMVRQGNLNWSWATDLGSSFINSFSYYGLGSPFFWLMCLFPHTAVAYILPFFNMLKFAVAALGAFCFLRRYAKNDSYAYIGAIVWAFSGFNIYNIFFQFLDAIALFPFLLWSLDEFIYNRRRGLFVLFVALNLLTNYFFFFGNVIFLCIYFVCKVICKEYKISIKEFINLFFESVLGCLCGIVFALPSVAEVLFNPRSTRFADGFGLWIYNKAQQYFAIAMSAFYPPDVPYNANMFTDANIKWSSLSAFLVLGGMFGFFIFLKYFKKSAFTKIFICCIIFAFVPVLNSSFYAFNRNYYARWFFMPLLILAAMNMQSFALDRSKIFYGLKITAILTAVFCIFALTPSEKDGVFKLGLQKNTAEFWLHFFISALCIYITFLIVYNFKRSSKYTSVLLIGAIVSAWIFGGVHMAFTKLPQLNNDADYKAENYDTISEFSAYDTKDFRIDDFNSYTNLGMFWDKPSIEYFSSTVNPSIMEFYPYVGVKRDVKSNPNHANYALRSLLSVKYMLMPHHELEKFKESEYNIIYDVVGEKGPFTILQNRYFIPMGFVYNNYVTYEQLDRVDKEKRSHILLRALLVDDNIIDKYKLGLEPLDDSLLDDFSFESYRQDVFNRIISCDSNFKQTPNGFICNIKLAQPNLVFFSVPYDKGFTATVNGNNSEIYKVQNGLCAVYAPNGESEIIFSYQTPYLKQSVILNIIGLCVYIIYLIYIFKKKEKI